jgi:hypothetical protein
MKLGQIALTFVVIAALSGCAVMDSATGPDAASPSATPAPADGAVSIMERSGVGGLPAGWEPWILHPKKRKTRYETRGRNGDTVVWAHADSAASGLARRLNLDPSATPWIEWRWRVDTLVEGADNTDRYAEDSPVRIVLAFDGDRRKLPARDQLFFEKAKLLSGGQEMPYATLMYIWENRQPVDTVITNPNTSRVRKIVVSSGEAGVGAWQTYRRNIIEDYRRAYGNNPGRLIGVAILTDTDNTRQIASAQYGKIRLLEK